MTPFAIIAWYGLALLAGQWALIGPYDDKAECTSVVEWLETQGIETESCTMASTDVDAVLIQIGERP